MSRPPPPAFPHIRAGLIFLRGYQGPIRFRVDDGTWVDATYAEGAFYRKGSIVQPPLGSVGAGISGFLPGTLVLPLEEAAVRDHVRRVLLRGVKCFCQDPAHPPDPDPESKCPTCLGSSWRYVPRDVLFLLDTPSPGWPARPPLTEAQSALLLQDAYWRWHERRPSLAGLVWADRSPLEGVIPRLGPERMASTFGKAGKSEESWIEGIHAFDYGVVLSDTVLLPA